MAPHMAVIAESAHSTAAAAATPPSTPIQENTLLYSTRTAALEHTVVRRAVAWVGDLAYMSGIHAWNGTVPSLVPNPMNSSTARIDSCLEVMSEPRPLQASMSPVPARSHMYPKAAIRTRPPMWVMAKNLHLGALSLSSAMRNVTMETISQEIRRRMTESAIMNSVHDT